MADRYLFIIFGALGDLARHKLLPSLHRVISESDTGGEPILLGVASRELDDEGYRRWAQGALEDAGVAECAKWCDEHVYYQQVGRQPTTLGSLSDKIAAIEADHHLPGNRVLYLALPPPVAPGIVTSLSKAGLNRSPGWTRLVIEKPFGHDLDSAHELNDLIHRNFEEHQVYRIDHYLGKETVRNLLVFRFANLLFEANWSRDRIEAVEITVAESKGIGSRANYYESAGVVRDMVQNHLTQLLTLVAMEAPSSLKPEAIRNAKVQVLDAIRPIDPDQVTFGQYVAGTIDGEPVCGYLDEEGIPGSSKTPTFVNLKLEIDNWRWQGVPFYLRTGKRLPQKATHIAIHFRRPPVCLFDGMSDARNQHQNVIVLILQPNEGFEVHFDVKAPGESLGLVAKQLRFLYSEEFTDLPDAYQTLIVDIIEGDQTLFVRADEVEASWRLYQPLLDSALAPLAYAAGTWGPHGAGPIVAF